MYQKKSSLSISNAFKSYTIFGNRRFRRKYCLVASRNESGCTATFFLVVVVVVVEDNGSAD